MSDIAVVDYGMGNLGSVVNAFTRLGETCRVVRKPRGLAGARGIVLPGVGAFHSAMENIRRLGFEGALRELVIERGTPFLGICLGMQLIVEDSVEGRPSAGLGWIAGHVRKLDPADGRVVPHVGWNTVEWKSASPLASELTEAAHFFYDHSYHVECRPENVVATCSYGGEWVAAVQESHIFAVQFHPEKSQRSGLRLLRNFLNFTRACS